MTGSGDCEGRLGRSLQSCKKDRWTLPSRIPLLVYMILTSSRDRPACPDIPEPQRGNFRGHIVCLETPTFSRVLQFWRAVCGKFEGLTALDQSRFEQRATFHRFCELRMEARARSSVLPRPSTARDRSEMLRLILSQSYRKSGAKSILWLHPSRSDDPSRSTRAFVGIALRLSVHLRIQNSCPADEYQ